MNIYLVHNKDGKYLRIKWGQVVTWGAKEEASIYNSYELAHEAGMHSFQWDNDGAENFGIAHLIAQDVTDFRCLTEDGKIIIPGGHYWLPDTHGVDRVQVEEISVTYYSGSERTECYCRLDFDFWSLPGCLYSTEPLAWVAWKEEQ